MTEKSRIECFWLEPTDRAEESLRRYAGSVPGNECPGTHGYHEAQVRVGTVPWGSPTHECSERDCEDGLSRDDERWPVKCDACGYAFNESDFWQHAFKRLYQPSNGGEPVALHDAAVGAMWDAPWYAENDDYRNTDGRSIVIRTPGGDWLVDGPASNGRWTRTGDPPKITVQGSILQHGYKNAAGVVIKRDYHGILTDGVLQEV